jgi:predicted transcriptional regulator
MLLFASHLLYDIAMKTATIPPIRVAPEFRTEVEGVLAPGESLSVFVESAIRETVARRKHQAEFVRRGIAAIQETQRTGTGIPSEVVIAKLEAKLLAARHAKAQRAR